MGKKFGIQKYKDLTKELEAMKKAPETVLNRTLSDVKTRVPGWVATEVAKQYGIKKGEIGDGKTSKLKVQGNKMPNVQLIYSGRVLTPVHFRMSPKVPKAGGGSYTLRYRVENQTASKVKKLTKKQRAALGKNFRREGTRNSDHSPIMLMAPKGTYLPFQRKSENRNDIQAIKTVSVPQMIDNEVVSENIAAAINEKLGKRLDHHMKLLEK